jgi:sugar lactone lactonase YvrE
LEDGKALIQLFFEMIHRSLPLVLSVGLLSVGSFASNAFGQSSLNVLAELQQAPGNLTVTPDEQLVMSLHQFYNPPYPVAEYQNGTVSPFLPQGEDSPVTASVLGILSDSSGIVWILDNAMGTDRVPQLVGWDSQQNILHKTISLADVTPTGSFINDLRIDETTQTAFITDPAGGDNAALIVVDLESGEARRVLEGHYSVTPEPIDLFVEGNPLLIRTQERTYQRPHVGVDAIALDPNNEWLYYGALHGTSLYRIRTADLTDSSLTDAALGERVEKYADKPICDGILMDGAGNIYLGELAANAIGVITPNGEYRRLFQDDRLSWVDDFEFSADGQTIYAVANRLHLSAPLNAGVEAGEPPFYIFEFEPLAPRPRP